MKKILWTVYLVAALAAMSSCSDNDDYGYGSIYDRIVGRTWVGDLGVTDYAGVPLESGVYFGSDGFGTDEVYYYNHGGYAGTLNILWNAYNGTIYLDYGREALPREVRDVYFRGDELRGELFIYGLYYGPTVLYMD